MGCTVVKLKQGCDAIVSRINVDYTNAISNLQFMIVKNKDNVDFLNTELFRKLKHAAEDCAMKYDDTMVGILLNHFYAVDTSNLQCYVIDTDKLEIRYEESKARQ